MTNTIDDNDVPHVDAMTRWRREAEKFERERAEHRRQQERQERQARRQERQAIDQLRVEMQGELEQWRSGYSEAVGEALGETVAETENDMKRLIEQRVTEATTTAAERLLQVQLALRTEFEQRYAAQAEAIDLRLAKEINAAVGNIEKPIKELETKLADRVIQGKQGPKGDVGQQGPPGKLPIAKSYAPGAVHYQADVVMWEGATWQALRDTAREPSTEGRDWVCLAAPGRDARSPIVRGTYNNATRYAAFDIVALDGGSFIARVDDPGVCPGPQWQLLAKQGKVGAKGPRGEIGPRGEPGVSLRGWKLDQESYTAVPILSDGREGPLLQLRPLFEQFFAETNRSA
jgi:hypothetical protein